MNLPLQCCQIPLPLEIILFSDCFHRLALQQAMFSGVRKKGSGKAGLCLTPSASRASDRAHPVHKGCSGEILNRITERSGLVGTFQVHLARPSCGEQGQLHPDQVAHGPVQPGLERFQVWGISHLSDHSDNGNN